MRPTGNEKELVKKVHDIVQTDSLEEELEAVPFHCAESLLPQISQMKAGVKMGFL